MLQDVTRDGRALVAASPITATMMGQRPDETSERDLSWLGFAGLTDLAANGSAFVFTHWGEGSGASCSSTGSGSSRIGANPLTRFARRGSAT